MRIVRTNPHGLQFVITSDCAHAVRVTYKVPGGDKTYRFTNMSIVKFLGQWADWMKGALIQDAFPTLNADEREFLKTGMFGFEWDEMFNDIPEDTFHREDE